MFDEVLPYDDEPEPGFESDAAEELAGEAGAALAAVESAQAAESLTEFDADATLAAAASSQRELNLIGARQLAVAAHWADLHGVLDCAPAGSIIEGDSTRSGGGATSRRRGREVLARPGGVGTPLVAEFAPAELGAVLGVSVVSAGTLVADALDLRHRLPLLWRQVQLGTVKIWVARRMAQRTRRLSREACARVDVKVAPVAAALPYGRLEKVLDAAVLAADPAQAAENTQAAADRRGVWVGRDNDHGVASVFARADVPDIAAFDRSLNTVARALGLLGDDASHDVRRARALGVLANPQAAVDLVDQEEAARQASRNAAVGAVSAGSAGCGAGSAGSTSAPDRRRCTLGPATLYVHVSRESLTDAAGVVRVEEIGPVLLDQARGWLGDRTVRLQPVIDVDAVPAVDCYEVPARMAEAVRLRTPAGFFPYTPSLTRGGDIDHTQAYVPVDDGGPPGQTNVGNLAHTKRREHRIKTHGRWNVTQPRSGLWLWRSPHGYHFLVDTHGTTPLGKI